MVRLIVRTLTLIMLAVVGTTVTAAAQSVRVTKVNIPFEFNFGNRSFPAGDYSIVQSQPHFLMLRNSQGRILAQLFTEGVQSYTPASMTKLSFVVSDGRYSLAEVWQERDSAGEHLYPPKSVRNLTKSGPTDASKIAGSGQP
jgi:hypothetical protein